MMDLKYTEILQLNRELGEAANGPAYHVAVLSNIITSQVNDILEYSLRKNSIHAIAASGDYDNIVQDSQKYNKSDLIIIFWEAANLVDGLQYKANVMDAGDVASLVTRLKSEIDFVLSNLEQSRLVLINKFSTLAFNYHTIRESNFDKICRELNTHLEHRIRSNTILIDIDKIMATMSVAKSIDYRYYYSSKAMYTVAFYKAYAQFITPIIRSVNGKAKKALIFDCDNTLWKGILGEDGFENIEMSHENKDGVVFEEVQHLALELNKRGVLIGLCSKNNFEDVENVINNHPDMHIRNENISIKKINWNDKLLNLKSIAEELNIGLDSIVFVDDSDFETGLIQDKLPQVNVLKVPTSLYQYPQFIRDHQHLFYSISESAEDLRRTEMYKQQAQREQEKTSFSDLESYLKSLELSIQIFENEKSIAPRMSQLTQKTNQFNLTTRRYTESEIENFVDSDQYTTFAFEAKDKFGNHGITGLSVIKRELTTHSASIDTFLMSCRIIGRNIEFAFFDFLINHLKKEGIKSLEAVYIKTMKNDQVSDFYEKLNFTIIERELERKKYVLNILDYVFQNINYIEVIHGRKN